MCSPTYIPRSWHHCVVDYVAGQVGCRNCKGSQFLVEGARGSIQHCVCRGVATIWRQWFDPRQVATSNRDSQRVTPPFHHPPVMELDGGGGEVITPAGVSPVRGQDRYPSPLPPKDAVVKAGSGLGRHAARSTPQGLGLPQPGVLPPAQRTLGSTGLMHVRSTV